MLAPPKSMPSPPPIKRMNVNKWTGGIVSAMDDGRVPTGGLLNATNMILDQDGVVRPRPTLRRFAPPALGTYKGEIFQAREVSGGTTTNWLLSMQTVGGVTELYYAKPLDASWTKATGKTYDIGSSARFCQVVGSVLIMTSKDKLSYFNISTKTVVPYVALSNASTPTTTLTGLSGSDYNIYYCITANSKVGETKAENTKTQAIGKDRNIWNPDTEGVKVSWTAVSNAESYNVYCGVAADGGGAPQLYAIATGLDASKTSFFDNGTRAQNTQMPAPKFNSTDGPTVSRGYVINGKVWLTGDVNEPYLVRYGGDYGHELDFSPANGGGFTPIGNGTKELPVRVVPFRDGRGNFQITALCQGISGQGKRYLLTPNSITYGNTTISFYSVTEDNGQDGTDAPDSVVLQNDSLWYVSLGGFKTTGTRPQLQNLLSTNSITNTIQDKLSNLNPDKLNDCVGLAYQNRIYWSLPVNSDKNNELWVLDLERGGAWMTGWNIPADWMFLTTDANGKTHHCVVSNNEIYELDYNKPTDDNGKAIITSGQSGQIPFSKDRQMWADLQQLDMTFLRPQGTITAMVSGENEDGEVVNYRETKTFGAETSAVGWADPLNTWEAAYSWGEIQSIPTSTNPANGKITIEVDEDLNWFQYSWLTTEVGVDYSLADATAIYIESGLLGIE